MTTGSLSQQMVMGQGNLELRNVIFIMKNRKLCLAENFCLLTSPKGWYKKVFNVPRIN